MGAFETFVNANLGIRKPLISDLGHPSGSLKAAGVVGSQYIDSESNDLYEKTGENNSIDWAFVRKLGVTSSSNVVSASIVIPQGSEELSSNFSDILNIQEINPPPQVSASLNFISEPANMYGYILHSVNTSGFRSSFSDKIIESDAYLSVFIDPKNSSLVTGTSVVSNFLSAQWFEESGQYLKLRESVFSSTNPARELWEEVAPNKITPRDSASQVSSDKQFFLHSGQFVLPSDNTNQLNTGDLKI